MKSGPKKALIVVVALLAVIGAGVFYVSTQLNSIVAGLIEDHGSAATDTPVRVGGVSIKLQDARAEIAQLTVGNPQGYGGDPAIELGNFAIRIEPSSVTSDTIVLNEVTVSGARLRILQQGGRNNLQALLDNLTRNSAGQESAEDGGESKKLIIDRFTLEDARAFVSLADLDETREIEIPTIVLNDIGRATNGATASAAAKQILAPVVRQSLQSAVAQSALDKAREKLDETKDKLIEGVLDSIGKDDKEN